jgi:hypothetical protein
MRIRGIAMLVGSLIVLTAVLESGSALGTASHESALQKVSFWKALPTTDFLTLGGEESARSRWVAFAYRSPRSKNSDRLCLQIPTAWLLPRSLLGVSPGVRECGSVGSGVAEPIVTSAPLHQRRESALVVATGSDAAEIGLTLTSGNHLRSPVHVIRGRRAAEARVSAFRYAVFKVSEGGCVRQISGERGDGTVAFETKEAACSPAP